MSWTEFKRSFCDPIQYNPSLKVLTKENSREKRKCLKQWRVWNALFARSFLSHFQVWKPVWNINSIYQLLIICQKTLIHSETLINKHLPDTHLASPPDVSRAALYTSCWAGCVSLKVVLPAQSCCLISKEICQFRFSHSKT